VNFNVIVPKFVHLVLTVKWNIW